MSSCSLIFLWQVKWSREGSTLDPTRHVISEDVVMGTRHILTIRSVQRDDFDTYTCTAQNTLGAMKGRMIVTGGCMGQCQTSGTPSETLLWARRCAMNAGDRAQVRFVGLCRYMFYTACRCSAAH